MNFQKRRIGTPEDETTTTTTIETFHEEEEEETMAVIIIISLKETVITVENKVMPKQPVGCFRATQAKDLLGLNREKTDIRQVSCHRNWQQSGISIDGNGISD
jgi:hypothetical protein